MPRRLLVFALFALGSVVSRVAVAQDVAAYGGPLTAYANSTNNWAQFTVYNFMGFTQTVNLGCSVSGDVTSCSVGSSIELAPDETAWVGVSYAVGSVGAGSVTLSASGPGGSDQEAHGVTVQSPISVDFHTGSENQSVALCAAACFAARHVQSTVPYFSGDQPRQVTLVYDGDRAHPRPYVFADVHLSAYNPMPTKFSFRVWDVASSSFLSFLRGGDDNDSTTMWFTAPQQTVRVGGQVDVRSDTTGARDIQVVVTFHYAGSFQEYRQNAVLITVNEASSPIAKGWTVAGVPRLYLRTTDSSALITDGAGSASFFRKCFGNCYLSPNGVASILRLESGYLTLVSPDSTKIRFDANGRALRVTDRLADTVTFGYDLQGRLTEIHDPFIGNDNDTTRLVYDANGLSEIRELQPSANARVTKVGVNSSGMLEWVMDPDTVSTQFRYDDSLRLASVINRRGDTSHYRYDEASWKLKKLRSPLVHIDTGAGPTVLDSVVTTLAPWQLVGVPTGPTTASTPATPATPSQVKATITDGEGHPTTFTVDRWGQPLVITDPGSGVTTIVRSGVNPVRVIYPEGGIDSLTYNGDKLTSMRPAGGSRINYRYGAYSQVDSIWGTGIAGQFFSLGAGGRVDWVRTAGSIVMRYFYDTRNRVDSVKDAGDHLTRFHYEGVWGHLDSTTYPGNRWSKRIFDTYGRDSILRAAETSPRTYLYDKLNRLVSQRVHIDTVFMTYDPLYLVRVRDAKRQVFRGDVNALGWTIREYDPADTSRYISSLYNRDGQITTSINRRGDTVRTRFDSLHRLVARRGTNIVADSFWYSANRRQVVGLNSVSRVEQFLSTAGWMDSVVTFLNGTRRFRVRYKPSAAFQLDSIGISTSTSIAFTPRRYYWNSPTTLLDSIRIGSQVAKLQRNAERLVSTTKWRPPSCFSPCTEVIRTESHTSLHQVYSSTFSNSTLDLAFWRSYSFDSTARIKTQARKNGSASAQLTHRYDYGNLQRQLVTDWTATGPCGGPTMDWGDLCGGPNWSLANSFNYDEAGNIDYWNGAVFSYGDGNRRVDRDYDPDGNQITRHSNPDSLKWDAANRLVRYRTFDGTKIVEFDYDAFGRLVRKRVNGVVRRHFLWEGSNLLAELDSTADRRVGEYAYLPGGVDRPLALITGATAVTKQRYFEQDQLGNVVGVFSVWTPWPNLAAPAVYESNHYEPWGLRSASSTTSLADTNRLRWKGLFWDNDVQLQYARARWYDPHVGRFLTEDPIGLSGGLNMYAFAGNDPINGRDPFGLNCEGGGGVGGGGGAPPSDGQGGGGVLASVSLSAGGDDGCGGGAGSGNTICAPNFSLIGGTCVRDEDGNGQEDHPIPEREPDDPRIKRLACFIRAWDANFRAGNFAAFSVTARGVSGGIDVDILSARFGTDTRVTSGFEIAVDAGGILVLGYEGQTVDRGQGFSAFTHGGYARLFNWETSARIPTRRTGIRAGIFFGGEVEFDPEKFATCLAG